MIEQCEAATKKNNSGIFKVKFDWESRKKREVVLASPHLPSTRTNLDLDAQQILLPLPTFSSASQHARYLTPISSQSPSLHNSMIE